LFTGSDAVKGGVDKLIGSVFGGLFG